MTVTEKVSFDSHGNRKVETTEEVDDGQGNVSMKRMLSGHEPSAYDQIGYDQPKKRKSSKKGHYY